MSMLAAALLIAAASAEADPYDQANLALTACSFETFREASAQNLGVERFERALQSRCAAERAKLRDLFIAGRMKRQGVGRAAAAREADALLGSLRSNLLGQYARRAETAARLDELERALKAQGQ